VGDFRDGLSEAVKRCMGEITGSKNTTIPSLYRDDLARYRRLVPEGLVPEVALIVQTVKAEGPEIGSVFDAPKDRDGILAVYADGSAVYCFTYGMMSTKHGVAQPGQLNAISARLSHKGLEVPAVLIRMDIGSVVFGVMRGKYDPFNEEAALKLINRIVELIGPG